jgi:soluble lytic murein transglycosylase
MLRRIFCIFFFTFTIISLSCAESGNGYELSAVISEKAFYTRPDQIIHQFEKNSGNCQKNFILAKAYKNKKELKSALMYYANSCFDKKYNFNIRLFPQPVYSFVESSRGRSIFYNDSLYEIASIFYDYNEHEYVLKFTDLMERDDSALYRESVLLRSKSLVKLNRFKKAIDELREISSSYKDSDSRSLIHLRLGAVYESAGELYKAADSYIDVIKSESGVWQNSISAKRLIYLIEDKKISLDSDENSIHFASALYDAQEYDRALAIAENILRKKISHPAEMIKLKILTLKNNSKANAFLKEREGKPGYDVLLLEQANNLWDKGNRYEAVKSYDRLSESADKEISERVLTRLSFFYEERNRPEFIKYMELYIKKFPESKQSGRFLWLMGRYNMKARNNPKALEYFARGIKNYPDNSYTSYCRFWMQKIKPANNKGIISDDFLAELAVNNPDTYHGLTLLKIKADKTESSLLQNQYEDAVKKKDMKKMQLYHTLLFIKNGYNTANSERIKQIDSDITGSYIEFADLLKNPSFSGDYKKLLRKIEVYFYAGDIDSVNREIKLIPDDDEDSQKDLALALIFYSIKHKYYNYSSFYSFRLLNLMKIKENLSLLPREFAEALYPYAFAGCVKKESKQFNVKTELILSMMKVESNFNFNAVSPAGAAGLMQLMPPTARGIAKEIGIAKYDLNDPCTSIKFGANYIAWLDRYYKGQIEYMVAGYNAGAGNVDKWKAAASNKEIDHFSEFTPFDETRDYIFRTKKYLIQYESIYKNSID